MSKPTFHNYLEQSKTIQSHFVPAGFFRAGICFIRWKAAAQWSPLSSCVPGTLSGLQSSRSRLHHVQPSKAEVFRLRLLLPAKQVLLVWQIKWAGTKERRNWQKKAQERGSTAEKSESGSSRRDFLDWFSSLGLPKINCKYIQDYILHTFSNKKFCEYFQSSFGRATGTLSPPLD